MNQMDTTERRSARERPGLTRAAVVARAVEIGNAEGLEAVSLRRLAQELGVTPMALYRHVHDKQDLINAMTDVVFDGIDATVGLRPEMTWTERMRLFFNNYKEQIDERPLALPLSMAYSGEEGPPGFWKVLEDNLAVLLDAGFGRRDAIVLIRMISLLLAGYLMLLRQGAPLEATLPPHEIDLLRKGFALAQMSLPRDEFPNLVEGAEDTAEVWLSDPDRWWGTTVDLITFGLERMLERSRERSQEGAS
jgi:TetR/AcrR family tetracycline transcriptional repressor